MRALVGLFASLRMAAVIAATLLLATGIQAAEVTIVSSAFDDDNPFDLKIELGWSYSWYSSKITRENRQPDPITSAMSIVDVAELKYRRTTSEIKPTIRAGLYTDMEFFVTWPFVIRDHQHWQPDDVVGLPENSTIHNTRGICADGLVDPSCEEALFPFTNDTGLNHSYRSGLNNGGVGFRWAILNEERHPWSPNWLVGFGYSFPMLSQRDPVTASSDSSSPSQIADRVHRWSFETALSRNMGLVDPFIRFHYTFPHARRNAYHNCDQSELLADMNRNTSDVENTCHGPTAVWTRDGLNYGGLKPAHVGGFEFGAELLPYVDPANFVRIAVQLKLGADFVSEGRDYTIISDALQRITYHEEFAHLHSTIGVLAQASKYTKLNAVFSFGYDTGHILTRETVGYDFSGTGVVELNYDSGDINKEERNPNYDFRWDQPGRRFRTNDGMLFTLMITGQLHF